MYYLVGYGAIGREAKCIPIPDFGAPDLITMYRTYIEDDRFPVKGDIFYKVSEFIGMSLDRLLFDWFIEWREDSSV